MSQVTKRKLIPERQLPAAVVKSIEIYGDMHRFLLAYAGLYTKKIVEFDVDYQERTYGEAHYGSLKRTFTVFLDLFSMKFMLSFATKPFTMMPGRIFGSTGLVSFSDKCPKW